MKTLVLTLAAALALASPAIASAQAGYPAKSVRIVIGFPPGSAADVVARIVSGKLGENTGQTFIVDNRPGAGSNIGTEFVARAPADGYTLLLSSIANTINASLYKNLSFDFLRDLTPVASVATLPNLLVVHPSLPVRSVKELVGFAKARPGEILYGSSGNGTSPHLSGELFNSMAKVKLVHIPYKGSPQAVTDLIAGRVQVMFAPASTALPHIKAAKLRALAASSAQRAGVAPDLPTVAESGLPGFETSIWFGLVAPAGTPREIVERLAVETARALADGGLKDRLATQGIEPMRGTSAQFAAYVREETAKWARVVKEAAVKID